MQQKREALGIERPKGAVTPSLWLSLFVRAFIFIIFHAVYT
jgi:hypothetical protein